MRNEIYCSFRRINLLFIVTLTLIVNFLTANSQSLTSSSVDQQDLIGLILSSGTN